MGKNLYIYVRTKTKTRRQEYPKYSAEKYSAEKYSTDKYLLCLITIGWTMPAMEWNGRDNFNWTKVRNADYLISGTRLGGGLDIWLTYDGAPINLIDLWLRGPLNFLSDHYAPTVLANNVQAWSQNWHLTNVWSDPQPHWEQTQPRSLLLSLPAKRSQILRSSSHNSQIYFCLNRNGLWLEAVSDPKGSQSSSHISVFWYFLFCSIIGFQAFRPIHCKIRKCRNSRSELLLQYQCN